MKPTTASPSPEFIFDTFNAYQRTAALRAAIELDVFTGIGEGVETAPALAQRCQTSERGMRILCDYLSVIGLLSRDDGRYALTLDSATFLNRRSPAYLGGASAFLTSSELVGSFDDLAAVVRQGGTRNGSEGTMAAEHPIWIEFARSMARMMAPVAEYIADLTGAAEGRPMKVLDIAAGHGLFGIAIARKNPNAEIVALDWPQVLEVAQENARSAAVDGRYRVLPGDAFQTDLGRGHDLALLTNFLHHVNPETCVALLRKIHGCLAEGGRVVTLEFIPNEDRVSPPAAAAFSLVMLGTTAAGDAYTFAEFERMFAEAGFARNELHDVPRSPQRVIVSYK